MSLFKFGGARRPQPSIDRQLELANILSRITYAMAEHLDLDGLFRVALRHINEQLPADFGAVLLLKHKTPTFMIQTLIPAPPVVDEQSLSEGGEIPVAQSGLSQAMREASIHQFELSDSKGALPEALARNGLRACIALPLTTDDGVQGMILVARDDESGFTTDESDMLHKLTQHMSQAFRQLTRRQESMQDQRLRALEEMAGGIAGEVSRALSPIVGFTETLRLQPPQARGADQLEKYVDVVSNSVRVVDQVVRRLRAFHRDRDESEVAVPIDLNELISECLSSMGPNWSNKAKQRGGDLRFDTDFQEIPLVLGNASELRQVLNHIVDNAVDAMPGGGTIRIGTRVAEEQYGGVARVTMHEVTVLEVTDSGTGMTDEVEQQCLEPFYSTKGEGRLGLGLALAYGIVQRHEGRIEIESHEGTGTTVRIELPSYLEDPRQAAQRATGPAQKTLSVLLVDENAKDRESVGKLLTGDGHEVSATGEGRDALEKLHAGWFDLAIIDHAMSDMSGSQLAEAIKRIAPSKPIIMMVDFGEYSEESSIKPPGVNEVLSKPTNLTDLRKVISTVLRKR